MPTAIEDLQGQPTNCVLGEGFERIQNAWSAVGASGQLYYLTRGSEVSSSDPDGEYLWTTEIPGGLQSRTVFDFAAGTDLGITLEQGISEFVGNSAPMTDGLADGERRIYDLSNGNTALHYIGLQSGGFYGHCIEILDGNVESENFGKPICPKIEIEGNGKIAITALPEGGLATLYAVEGSDPVISRVKITGGDGAQISDILACNERGVSQYPQEIGRISADNIIVLTTSLTGEVRSRVISNQGVIVTDEYLVGQSVMLDSTRLASSEESGSALVTFDKRIAGQPKRFAKALDQDGAGDEIEISTGSVTGSLRTSEFLFDDNFLATFRNTSQSLGRIITINNGTITVGSPFSLPFVTVESREIVPIIADAASREFTSFSNSNGAVIAQRRGITGAPVAAPLQVSTSSPAYFSDVTLLDDGSSVASFSSSIVNSGADISEFTQRISGDGVRIGDEQLLRSGSYSRRRTQLSSFLSGYAATSQTSTPDGEQALVDFRDRSGRVIGECVYFNISLIPPNASLPVIPPEIICNPPSLKPEQMQLESKVGEQQIFNISELLADNNTLEEVFYELYGPQSAFDISQVDSKAQPELFNILSKTSGQFNLTAIISYICNQTLEEINKTVAMNVLDSDHPPVTPPGGGDDGFNPIYLLPLLVLPLILGYVYRDKIRDFCGRGRQGEAGGVEIDLAEEGVVHDDGSEGVGRTDPALNIGETQDTDQDTDRKGGTRTPTKLSSAMFLQDAESTGETLSPVDEQQPGLGAVTIHPEKPTGKPKAESVARLDDGKEGERGERS